MLETGDFLAHMARRSAARAAERARRDGLDGMRRRALDGPAPRPLRLHADGFDVFAEIKRASPSSGPLVVSQSLPVASRAQEYASAGAAAISVLTESEAFGGALDDLVVASAAVEVPVMRKDFLVDPLQVFEARVHGAGGVLLIVRLLDDARLDAMIEAAAESGLFVLLEAFDRRDLERAGAATARAASVDVPLLLGLNSRDLQTLEVDPDRFVALRDAFPEGATRVAESGLNGPDDTARVAVLGYRVALVGSAVMRAADPAAQVAAMIAAGRGAAAREVDRCASG